jgi:hypothetical protein
MSVEHRQLQATVVGGDIVDPGRREYRVICDQCGIPSPWQTRYPGAQDSPPPPAWFLTSTTRKDGLNETRYLCGFCAGGGGKTLALPKPGSIWWCYTPPRSVAKVITVDSLGSVSITVVYSSKGPVNLETKRSILPIKDFYSIWGLPRPDSSDLSPRAIWFNFMHQEPVVLDGAEYLGGNDFLVCCKGQRIRFLEFVRDHAPTGLHQPRSRYERLLEDDHDYG